MNKALGIVMVIVAVAIAFIVFPIILDGSTELRTNEYSEVFAAVTTGDGETSANVTLAQSLWKENPVNVVSIVSDNVSDTPVAATYTEGSNALTINGLVASGTRTLTVKYRTAALSDYTGFDSIVAVAPLLVFIGILGAIIGGLWTTWKTH